MRRLERVTNGHVANDSLEKLVHVGRGSLRLFDDGDDSLTVLSVIGSLYFGTVEVSNLLRWHIFVRNHFLETAKLTNLKTVTDTEYRNTVREYVRVDTGSIDIVDGVGRTRENNS